MCFPKRIGITSALAIALVPLVALASQPDSKAADAVSAAFIAARESAHLSRLSRIDGNTFAKQVCTNDLRMPSGWINDVRYKTSDPAQLPDEAQRLARTRDFGKTAARFGVGVCSLGSDSSGKMSYDVLIAIYESKWTSFWRMFWE